MLRTTNEASHGEFAVCLRVEPARGFTIIEVTGPVEALLGYSIRHLLCGDFQLTDLLHPDDADIAEHLASGAVDFLRTPRNARIRQADGGILCMVMTLDDRASTCCDTIGIKLEDARRLPRTIPDADVTADLKAILENTTDYIYFKDSHHVFTGASKTLVSLCEPINHRGEFIGLTDYDVFPAAYADAYYRLEKQVFAGAEVAQEIQEMLSKDGARGWVDNRKYPIRDGNGDVIGLYGIARDITDLMTAQMALRIERDYSRNILETVEAIIVALDREGNVSMINRHGCATLGYASDELVGQNWFDVCLPQGEALAAARATFRRALTGDVSGAQFFENQIVTQTGLRRDIAWRNSILRDDSGDVIGTLSAGEDVTERKALSQRLERVARHVGGMLYQYQQWPDGRTAFPYASAGIKNVYGVTPEAVMSDAQAAFDRIHPDDYEQVTHSIAKSFESAKVWHDTYRVQDSDGRVRWVEGEATPERQADGSVVWHGYITDITDRKAAIDALSESERRFSVIFHQAGTGMALLSTEGRWLQVNDRLCDIVGWDRGALLNMTFRDITHPDDLAINIELFNATLNGAQPSYAFDKRCLRTTGEARWVRVTNSVVKDDEDHPSYFIMVVEDIHDRKVADAKLREAAAVFRSTDEGVVITDTNATICDVNAAFTRITGYLATEVIGRNASVLQSGRHSTEFYKNLWTALRQTGSWCGEIWNRSKTGEIFPERMTISAVHSDTGEVTGYVGVFADITAIKHNEARLAYLSQHDPLTNLPNRTLLYDRLEQSLIQSRRRGSRCAVAFVDLDRFKGINDTFGHKTGDSVLIAASERLIHAVRAQDTVARVSGDEFCIVLNDVESAEAVATVMDKLVDRFQAPFDIEGNKIHATISAGVAIFPDDATNKESLLALADTAMFRAKDDGRSAFRFSSKALNSMAIEVGYLESALHLGLDRNEFFIVFQPQVDITTGRLVGAEALIRWRHPEKGVIAPCTFIPIAEKCGFMRTLGAWIFLEASRQWNRWHLSGCPMGRLSVNVSGVQLCDSRFLYSVEQCLAESGLPPEKLALEMTESFLMRETGETVKVLSKLRAMGITIAIDDFGTGYSSLSYLKKLPVDTLKIDQSFVSDIPKDSSDIAITRTIVAMGRALNLDVVAEGVETKAQVDFLKSCECRFAQGYYFSHPLQAPDMEAWAKNAGQST